MPPSGLSWGRLSCPRRENHMIDIDFRDDMTVTLVNCMGGDESILDAMLVSSGAQRDIDPKRDAGRINFLMKNRHGTPFEHASMTFRVEAPLFVWREHHRHRIGFSYNEESGRYKQLEPVFYLPGLDRPLQQVGKPGAYSFEKGTPQQSYLTDCLITNNAYDAYGRYKQMLDNGIAKEVARMVLPVNIYSTCYVTCNPRSLMAFLSLRTKDEDSTFPSYPQREIEMVAEAYESKFEELFPLTYEAFDRNGRVAP